VALEAEISRLTAEQELDGVDHTKRLTALQGELATVTQALATWPDVEAELLRRLDIAAAALGDQEHAERLTELAQLRQAEADQRLAFARHGLALLEAAQALQATLDRKALLREGMVSSGRGVVETGDPQPPTFYHGWLRGGPQGFSEGQRTMQALLTTVSAN
jgi:hypothetical protein